MSKPKILWTLGMVFLFGFIVSQSEAGYEAGQSVWTTVRTSFIRAKDTTGVTYENSAGTDLLQFDGDVSDSDFELTNVSSSQFSLDNGNNCTQFRNAGSTEYLIFCPTGNVATTRTVQSDVGFKAGTNASLPSTITYWRCASATINYPSIGANSTNTQVILAGTFTANNPCIAGCAADACHDFHLTASCYVNDTDGDIYMRLANPSAAAQDPPSATYTACVLNFS